MMLKVLKVSLHLVIDENELCRWNIEGAEDASVEDLKRIYVAIKRILEASDAAVRPVSGVH